MNILIADTAIFARSIAIIVVYIYLGNDDIIINVGGNFDQ